MTDKQKKSKAKEAETRFVVVIRSGGHYTAYLVNGSRTFTTASGAVVESMTFEEFETRFGMKYPDGWDKFHFTDKIIERK